MNTVTTNEPIHRITEKDRSIKKELLFSTKKNIDLILLPLETLSGNHEMEVKTKHIKHCIYISINNIENLVSFHFYAIQHFNTQFNNSILLAKHNLQKTSKSHRFSDNFCGNRNQ